MNYSETETGKTILAIAMLKNMKMREIPEEDAQKVKSSLEYDLKITEDKERIKKLLDSELYKFRPARALFISVVEMFIQINDVALKGGKQDLLDKYTKDNYDCICFDDLGAEKLTDAKRENLYYIIDSRYRNMLPTIITTNFTIDEINQNEPRIASRLSEMGKILQFNGKDYRLN